MDAVLILLVVVVALAMLNESLQARGGRVQEWLGDAALKLVGAMAGSFLAVWFRRSARWCLQAVSGTWIGFVTSGWLVDFMAWPVTPDYLLMSGSGMGLIGFSLLQIIMSPEAAKALRGRLGKAQ